jgi:predicted anti-sigma-YlaC factor YlaD
MNCKEARSLLSEFYDQELNQETSKTLEKHLAGCSECQKEDDNFNKILKILNKLKTYDIPRDYLEGKKNTKKGKILLVHKKLSKFIKRMIDVK